MTDLERFRLPGDPVARQANQVVGEHYRITVLTLSLIHI